MAFLHILRSISNCIKKTSWINPPNSNGELLVVNDSSCLKLSKYELIFLNFKRIFFIFAF
jgi:hypothetical protein